MKYLIITILLIVSAITSFAQLDTVTVNAGQYSIHGLNVIDSTIVRQNTGSYSIIYDSRYSTVSVADTVFYIPSTSGLDTISNFTRPSGKIAAIVAERGGIWRESITVPDDSLIFDCYGSGDLPVINGADVISDWYQTDLADGWDFTSGFSGNATIDNSTTFTSTGAQYIRKQFATYVEGDQYKIRIAGTHTSAFRVYDYNINSIN